MDVKKIGNACFGHPRMVVEHYTIVPSMSMGVPRGHGVEKKIVRFNDGKEITCLTPIRIDPDPQTGFIEGDLSGVSGADSITK